MSYGNILIKYYQKKKVFTKIINKNRFCDLSLKPLRPKFRSGTAVLRQLHTFVIRPIFVHKRSIFVEYLVVWTTHSESCSVSTEYFLFLVGKTHRIKGLNIWQYVCVYTYVQTFVRKRYRDRVLSFVMYTHKYIDNYIQFYHVFLIVLILTSI